MKIVTVSKVEPDFEGDYYAVLTVHKTSSLAEIVRSYRTLIRKYHPDHNPDISTDEFKLIQKAYEILSDKKKRAFYDETGVTPAPKEEVETKGAKLAENKLLEVCNNICSDASGVDLNRLKSINPVCMAKDSLKQELVNCKKAQTSTEVVIKKLQFIILKFTKKNSKFGATFVGYSLSQQLTTCRNTLGEMKNAELVLDNAIVSIATREYEMDPPPQPTFKASAFEVNRFIF